jgi:cysteinyl-tRNA synthetase
VPGIHRSSDFSYCKVITEALLIFSEDALSGAENGLQSLQEMLRTIDNAENGNGDSYDLDTLKQSLESKLNDDFNTAQAIAVLFDELKKIRKQINSGGTPKNIDEIQNFLHDFVDGVLGLWPEEEEVTSSKNDKTEQLIELLIDIRSRARHNKNFKLSDTIRDRLKDLDIKLMDNPEGTEYSISK